MIYCWLCAMWQTWGTRATPGCESILTELWPVILVEDSLTKQPVMGWELGGSWCFGRSSGPWRRDLCWDLARESRSPRQDSCSVFFMAPKILLCILTPFSKPFLHHLPSRLLPWLSLWLSCAEHWKAGVSVLAWSHVGQHPGHILFISVIAEGQVHPEALVLCSPFGVSFNWVSINLNFSKSLKLILLQRVVGIQ